MNYTFQWKYINAHICFCDIFYYFQGNEMISRILSILFFKRGVKRLYIFILFLFPFQQISLNSIRITVTTLSCRTEKLRWKNTSLFAVKSNTNSTRIEMQMELDVFPNTWILFKKKTTFTAVATTMLYERIQL